MEKINFKALIVRKGSKLYTRIVYQETLGHINSLMYGPFMIHNQDCVELRPDSCQLFLRGGSGRDHDVDITFVGDEYINEFIEKINEANEEYNAISI